jgi:hypothetical protein
VEPLTFAVDGSGEKVEFQELVSVEVVAQAPAGGATVLLKNISDCTIEQGH